MRAAAAHPRYCRGVPDRERTVNCFTQKILFEHIHRRLVHLSEQTRVGLSWAPLSLTFACTRPTRKGQPTCRTPPGMGPPQRKLEVSAWKLRWTIPLPPWYAWSRCFPQNQQPDLGPGSETCALHSSAGVNTCSSTLRVLPSLQVRKGSLGYIIDGERKTADSGTVTIPQGGGLRPPLKGRAQ